MGEYNTKKMASQVTVLYMNHSNEWRHGEVHATASVIASGPFEFCPAVSRSTKFKRSQGSDLLHLCGEEESQ